ncbi:unnamed protein product [marine sediment metagenome]|uniref:Uncharacterized protein n=1 Tax=marine sediment metagenome TaxID=412755 RepID=X1P116_9ZZZZ
MEPLPYSDNGQISHRNQAWRSLTYATDGVDRDSYCSDVPVSPLKLDLKVWLASDLDSVPVILLTQRVLLA